MLVRTILISANFPRKTRVFRESPRLCPPRYFAVAQVQPPAPPCGQCFRMMGVCHAYCRGGSPAKVTTRFRTSSRTSTQPVRVAHALLCSTVVSYQAWKRGLPKPRATSVWAIILEIANGLLDVGAIRTVRHCLRCRHMYVCFTFWNGRCSKCTMTEQPHQTSLLSTPNPNLEQQQHSGTPHKTLVHPLPR